MQDQTTPGHDELLSQVAAVAAGLSAHIAASERERCLPPAAEAAMRRAGLYRITAPQEFGGYECGPRALIEGVTAMARTYASAGWVLAIYTMHTWMVGMFSEKAQEEVFAGGPDVGIAGGLAPQGSAEPVEGGWRIGGRWRFGSGVSHSDWYLASANLTTSTKERPKQIHFLVPRLEIATEDTWYTLGLRGTGSYDVVLKDVFVPSHRAICFGTLFRGESPFARQHATSF